MTVRTVAVVAGLALGLMSGVSEASTILSVSGILQGDNSNPLTPPPQTFSAQFNLNVVGNTIESATGSFTGFGFTSAPVALITKDTPYDENNSSDAPVGFRANDGTDFYLEDQRYPISGYGPLFTIGTDTPERGGFPLFTVFDNGGGSYFAQFTGNVNGVEYYVFQNGVSLNVVSSVPLPASAPMFGAALLGLSALGYTLKRKTSAAAV